MPAPRKYPQELRERASRLVQEAQKEDSELSLNAAVIRIGSRTGDNADSLRGRVKQAAIDAGQRPGVTRGAAKRIAARGSQALSTELAQASAAAQRAIGEREIAQVIPRAP